MSLRKKQRQQQRRVSDTSQLCSKEELNGFLQFVHKANSLSQEQQQQETQSPLYHGNDEDDDDCVTLDKSGRDDDDDDEEEEDFNGVRSSGFRKTAALSMAAIQQQHNLLQKKRKRKNYSQKKEEYSFFPTPFALPKAVVGNSESEEADNDYNDEQTRDDNDGALSSTSSSPSLTPPPRKKRKKQSKQWHVGMAPPPLPTAAAAAAAAAYQSIQLPVPPQPPPASFLQQLQVVAAAAAASQQQQKQQQQDYHHHQQFQQQQHQLAMNNMGQLHHGFLVQQQQLGQPFYPFHGHALTPVMGMGRGLQSNVNTGARNTESNDGGGNDVNGAKPTAATITTTVPSKTLAPTDTANNSTFHPQIQQQQQQQQQAIMQNHLPPLPPPSSASVSEMLNTKAVYFGWIRHPATKTWRDVIKEFSQNHTDFPSWSDAICQLIKAKLIQDHGIGKFFICRKPGQDHGNNSSGLLNTASNSGGTVERKKIFGKNKTNLGTWHPATTQEVLDRTKQRFVDDRKPHAMNNTNNNSNGAADGIVKRPRGRPPKNSTAGAPDMNHNMNVTSATTTSSTTRGGDGGVLQQDSAETTGHASNPFDALQKFLSKCRADLQRGEFIVRNQLPSQDPVLELTITTKSPPTADGPQLENGTPSKQSDENFGIACNADGEGGDVVDGAGENDVADESAAATMNAGGGGVLIAADTNKDVSDEPSKLLEVMRDLEQLQMTLRSKLEISLKQEQAIRLKQQQQTTSVTAAADKEFSTANVSTNDTSCESENNLTNIANGAENNNGVVLAKHNKDETDRDERQVADSEDHEATSNGEHKGPNESKSSIIRTIDNHAARQQQPWFPVLSDSVCFEWYHHPGTIQWRNAIETFSVLHDYQWTDSIANLVMEKLANDNNIIIYLVFLDANQQPCHTIRDGMWYVATNEQVVMYTKQQFMKFQRQHDDDDDDDDAEKKRQHVPLLVSTHYETGDDEESQQSSTNHHNFVI